MSEQYSYIEPPAKLRGDGLRATLNKMNELCLEYVSVENKRDAANALHGYYWESIIEIVVTMLKREKAKTFSLPREMNKWVNIGYISKQLYEGEDISLYNEVGCEQHSNYFFSTAVVYIEERYADIVRSKTRETALRALRDAQDGVNLYPERKRKSRQKRDEFENEYPLCAKVMAVSHEIDDILDDYVLLKDKIDNGKFLKPHERTHYVQLNERLTKLRDKRTALQEQIKEAVPQHELMRLDREAEECIHDRLQLLHALENAQKAYVAFEDWYNQLDMPVIVQKMKTEIRSLRSMIELLGKRAQIRQCSVLTGKSEIPSFARMAEEIDNVLDVAPLILKARQANSPFPRFVLVPGFGEGIYHFEHNVVMLPTRLLHGLRSSIGIGLFEYFLDSPVGNVFREEYRRLPKYKGIRSSIELRNSMMQDFFNWIQMETQGYSILDRDVRKFFMDYVAPHIWSVRVLGADLLVTRQDAILFLEEYDNKQGDSTVPLSDPVLQNRVGVMAWKLDKYARALQEFRTAYNGASDRPEIVYNYALAATKAGQVSKASDLWKKYLALDRRGFWCSRAQEFLSGRHMGK